MRFRSTVPVLILAIALAKFTSATSPETDLSQAYAPTIGPCPSDLQWIRPAAGGLNPSEAAWVRKRRAVILGSFAEYLDRLGLKDFDLISFLKAVDQSEHENVPSLGLAISGGGYSSAYTGSGAIRALDDRCPAARKHHTGGLLQMMLYQTGLSGGGWPTTSFPAHNWPTADEIVDLWSPDIARPAAGSSTAFAPNSTSIFTDLAAKFKAGFPVTTADFFGRAWAYEYFPGVHGGIEMTYSSLLDIPALKNHQAPLPILHMSTISPNDPYFYGLQTPFENASTYEMTPFEFGSWQGDFKAFTPTAWLGTELRDGRVVNESACVSGFDKLSFAIGSSAAAINMWTIGDLSNGTLATFAKRSDHDEHVPSSRFFKWQNNVVPLSSLNSIVQALNETFGENRSLVSYASWPNPFAGLDTTAPGLRNQSYLKIVDGSEAGQAIPIWSMIQPARRLDFIIGWDSGGDAHPYQWNNGTNLYNTYIAANASKIPFPIIPSGATFIANNYTHKPVFFGCNANLTTTKDPATPIVLYFANAPYSAYTNYSYAQSVTTKSQLGEIFVNSFDQVTQGNGTLDAEWAQCLGCAAIDRSVARVGMKRTAQCQSCMERYCWDGNHVPEKVLGPPCGTYDATEVVDLEMVLKPGITFAEWNMTNPF